MIGIKQYEIERTWSEFKDFHDKVSLLYIFIITIL